VQVGGRIRLDAIIAQLLVDLVDPLLALRFNQQYLMWLPVEDLIARIRPELVSAGLWSDDLSGDRRAWFKRALALLVPRRAARP
jgi:hypothetical protein